MCSQKSFHVQITSELYDQAGGHITDPMIDIQPRTGPHELTRQGH